MRLTLRTLLAYMDGVLSPEEQEELKKQIEASELASELIHRTGDVVRRPQVGVPEVLGLGPIDDPNTMAEYLDGTLPDENVADFERACLDSEAMLAEAASAHHALKLVLSQHGDIDLDTLKRMQWLPQILQEATQVRVEAPHTTPEPAIAEAETQQVEPEAEEDSHQLPNYLREQRARQKARAAWLRWAPAIASLLLLGTTAFLIFGPSRNVDNGEQANRSESSVVEEGDKLEDVVEEGASEVATTGSPDVIPSEDSTEDATTEVAETTLAETGQAGTGLAETGQVEDSIAPSLDGEPSVSSEVVEELNPDATDSMVAMEEVSEETSLNRAADTSADTDPSISEPDATTTDTLTAEISDVEPAKLVFSGPETSLLVVEEQPEVWSRVSVEEELLGGKRLVSMPTYRPTIMLGSNLRIELVDYSEAIIDIESASDEDGEAEPSIPSIDLSHGRLLLHNLSQEEILELTLIIDGVRCHLTIEPGLPVAIEADRIFDRGLDLLNQSPVLNARVFAQGGNLTWEANGGIYKASQAKQWDLTPQGEPSEPRNFAGDPGWIEGMNNNAWDRRASPQLPKRVSAEKEVWPQLREIVDSDSYKEVRALAAHCSLAVGHPDILVASFDDESQQASWARNLEKLRVAASRSQVDASRIHRAMEEQYGEKLSADLFVLLCGFSSEEVGITDEELQRGALLQLIDWLESDSLACRVLATLNLEQLTGRIAFYNPTDQSGRRRQDIRKIRKRLRENDLRLDMAVE